MHRDLAIEVPWIGGNRFHYWVPESIAGTAIYEHEPWSTAKQGDALSYPYHDDHLTFQVLAIPSEDELAIQITLQNTSAQIWTNRFINCCFGLWDAPEFGGDKTMQRTFVVQRGELRPLCEINPWAGADSLKTFYPTRGHQAHPYWQQQSSIRKLCTETVDEGLMTTSSVDGRSTVAVAFAPPVLCVFNNTDDAFQCIHAMPLIECLEPGKQLTAIGKVYFDRGGSQACWERYKNDLRNWST